MNEEIKKGFYFMGVGVGMMLGTLGIFLISIFLILTLDLNYINSIIISSIIYVIVGFIICIYAMSIKSKLKRNGEWKSSSVHNASEDLE